MRGCSYHGPERKLSGSKFSESRYSRFRYRRFRYRKIPGKSSWPQIRLQSRYPKEVASPTSLSDSFGDGRRDIDFRPWAKRSQRMVSMAESLPNPRGSIAIATAGSRITFTLTQTSNHSDVFLVVRFRKLATLLLKSPFRLEYPSPFRRDFPPRSLDEPIGLLGSVRSFR